MPTISHNEHNLVNPGVIDEIYKKYKAQINAVVEATNKNYTKSAEIVSWFYGGSVERWRHVLSVWPHHLHLVRIPANFVCI